MAGGSTYHRSGFGRRRAARPTKTRGNSVRRRQGQREQVKKKVFTDPEAVIKSLQDPLQKRVAACLLDVEPLPRNQRPGVENIAAHLKVGKGKVTEAAREVKRVQFGAIIAMFAPESKEREIAERLLGVTGNPFRPPTTPEFSALATEFGTRPDVIREVSADILREINRRSREV